MNIKEFLIDNYIWILVIIVITIITIIGFLADKKKGDKKVGTNPQPTPNLPNQPTNNVMPIQYQQQSQLVQQPMNNDNIAMNYNNVNLQPFPSTQQMGIQPNSNTGNINNGPMMVTEPQPVQMAPTNPVPINNPQPIEPVAPVVEQEPMYQPLSEQRPIISPQPVPNFSNSYNQTNVDTVNPSSNMTQTINNNVVNNIPLESTNQQVVPMQQNTMTIPQPVNPQPIPVPQPVVPEPIMAQPQYNSQPMPIQPNVAMPQNYLQTPIQNTVPQPQVQQQMQEPPVNIPQQPINFVYGPQNNNQNMM